MILPIIGLTLASSCALPFVPLNTLSSASSPHSATLAWNAVTGSSVAGYEVHYGEANGAYTAQINAGTKTSVTVTGLNPGQTYYFAVTAYTSNGTASPYSNQVTYTVPAN